MPGAAKPMSMSMDGPLGISMDRMGSGTTWVPDAVALPSRHRMAGEWSFMFHGFLWGHYDTQSGPRGRDQFGSLNWAMIMADRPLAGGRLELRFMPSLDPLTVGKCGYPMLLQTGEECDGAPIVDRQHPHDFFMELGALYERELTSSVAGLVYVAAAGEPALGPVAFMHRPSAMDNPMAPLGHHWQDATHIAFGVVTAGLYTRRARLEASAFNGIEPDDARWDIEKPELNSFSTRLTVNPTPHWSFTLGAGSILHPETSDPDAHLQRIVASAQHGVAIGDHGQWATSAVVGVNRFEGKTSASALVESEALIVRKHTIYGRAELVQKTAADLAVASLPPGRRLNVGAITLGFIRELRSNETLTLGIGASGTLNFVPSLLDAAYGSRTPTGAMLFLRLRPYHSSHDAPRSPAAQP